MKNKVYAQRVLVTIFIVCLMVTCVACGNGLTVEKAYEETGKYIYGEVTDPVTGSVGGEWAIVGLSRSEFEVDDEYFSSYISNTEEVVKAAGGVLNTRNGYKYTEYSRIIIGYTAACADPTNVAGYNFLEKLSNIDNVCRQGINGPVWALIAFDCGSYEIPSLEQSNEAAGSEDAGTQTTREGLINKILEAQLSDGGWDFAGTAADPDMTGMALTALAPYYCQNAPKLDEVSSETLTRVKVAVDEALATLSKLQADDGTFGYQGETTAESMAQVIVALCALGIDCVADDRFIKEGTSLLDGLLTMYDEEGGFYHTKTDIEPNQMATEQGYYALTAYFRMKRGESPLYQMKK